MGGGCMAADSERAGLDYWTVGMMLGVIEMGSTLLISQLVLTIGRLVLTIVFFILKSPIL